MSKSNSDIIKGSFPTDDKYRSSSTTDYQCEGAFLPLITNVRGPLSHLLSLKEGPAATDHQSTGMLQFSLLFFFLTGRKTMFNFGIVTKILSREG